MGGSFVPLFRTEAQHSKVLCLSRLMSTSTGILLDRRFEPQNSRRPAREGKHILSGRKAHTRQFLTQKRHRFPQSEHDMEPTRLGGIKVHQGSSHLASCCPRQDSALFSICRCIASDRVNMTLLTHTSDTAAGDALTTLCMRIEDTSPYFFLIKALEGRRGSLRLQSDMDILSIFPHNQNPTITGKLLFLLQEENVPAYGFASSPGAMSLVIDSQDTPKVVQGLFRHFQLPSCHSPLRWRAAYQHQEELFREIICSYEEKVIKTYGLTRHPDLDLCGMVLYSYQLASLGSVLEYLGEQGVRMPFFVGQPSRDGQLTLTAGFGVQHRQAVKEAFARLAPRVSFSRRSPASVIMLHGPHFGDRYGIASALLNSLVRARLTPLALSCAVSSMSLAVRNTELEAHIRALHTNFLIPSSEI